MVLTLPTFFPLGVLSGPSLLFSLFIPIPTITRKPYIGKIRKFLMDNLKQIVALTWRNISLQQATRLSSLCKYLPLLLPQPRQQLQSNNHALISQVDLSISPNLDAGSLGNLPTRHSSRRYSPDIAFDQQAITIIQLLLPLLLLQLKRAAAVTGVQHAINNTHLAKDDLLGAFF